MRIRRVGHRWGAPPALFALLAAGSALANTAGDPFGSIGPTSGDSSPFGFFTLLFGGVLLGVLLGILVALLAWGNHYRPSSMSPGASPTREERLKSSAPGDTAEDVMTPAPTFATPDTPLSEVARWMVIHSCGALPVVEDVVSLRPVGIVTDRDITCRAVAQGRDPAAMTAADCMSSPVVVVSRDTPIEECVATLEQRELRRLVVVDAEGRCCGILSRADLGDEVAGGAPGRVSTPAREASPSPTLH
jgi:CBS domain-containing protein